MDPFKDVVQNPLGFWEAKEKPNNEELQAYYAEQYYQNALGSYRQTYSDLEISCFYAKLKQRWHVIKDRFAAPGSMLDVGCGEGYAIAHFSRLGWNVKGLDFSSAGIEDKNPEFADKLVAGDVFELLDDEIERGNTYDILWLQNVLEHVIDPVSLLNQLRKLVSENGVLVVTVPNDFSNVQLKAAQRGLIDRAFWVAIPDHLSYFSYQSLDNIGQATGWETIETLADFPIDWLLFHSGSNYVAEPNAGSDAHLTRVIMENLIDDNPTDQVVEFFASMARLGLGRGLTSFYSATKND